MKKALVEIHKIIDKNKLTRDEVLGLFEGKEKQSKGFNFLKMLNYIGGVVLFFGIAFIVSLYWPELGEAGQIFTTLGIGIIAYIIGVLVNTRTKSANNGLANSVFLISSLLIPGGVFVVLDKLGRPPENLELVTAVVFGALAVIFGTSNFKLKTNIISAFTWIYSVIGYVAFVSFLIPESTNEASRLYGLAGFVFTTISLIIARKMIENNDQTGRFIEFFTIPYYMVSIGLVINGFLILDILFLGIIFSIFYLGSRFDSTIYYIHGFIAMIVYLFYLNGEYFASVLGWPISLILTGIVIIATSTLLLRRKDSGNN